MLAELWLLGCVLALVALACAGEAGAGEEPMLGMGRRYYLGEGRLDITYTTSLPTPHIDWADPYRGGPVRTLAVPSVMEGRTLVELMQRLSLEVDAVTIDPAWDVNKWTMSFGEAYGARSEQLADGRIEYNLVYGYLQEDLASDRRWEVMVMHGILGWGHLPAQVRALILRRVREGMGLVLVGPQAGPELAELPELSPLLPVEGGVPDSVRPQAWSGARGAWEAATPHYVTAGVPLDTFPGDHLGRRSYRAAPGATVLVTAGGEPLLAVRQVGSGRVVAFGYENYGLAPFVRWDSYGEIGDAWWETWYSLMIRAIVWAAGREPARRVAALSLEAARVPVATAAPLAVEVALTGEPLPAESLAWQVRSAAGEVVAWGEGQASGAGARLSVATAHLPGGRYLVDVFLTSEGQRVDWASAGFVIEPPVRLSAVSAPETIEEGRPFAAEAAVEAALPAGIRAVAELVDNYGRVVAAQEAAASSGGRGLAATLATDDLLTHIGWVRFSLWEGDRLLDSKQRRVAFAAGPASRVWDDYEVNVPFYGPHNYYHWMPLVDQQYRRAGITWLMEPERNFRFTVLAQPGGTGVYYYDRKPFEEQMAKYWETGDKRYLVRNPCLHGEWRDEARQVIQGKIAPYLKYRPFHYYIADEPSLTSYTRAFDFCWSPQTLAAFREWLQRRYRTLRALNEVWGSRYARWSQVEPPTTLEAQQQGRIAAWGDFRRFMDLTFAEAMRYTQQVVEELDPGALTLVGGTQMPTPFNGTDWWLLSRTFGILEPYFGIPQFRSFNPGLPIIQACGYQDEGSHLEEELWRRALQGQRGATIFWNYTLHDPDLVLNSQGEAMARAFGALRGQGIAKLLLGARRDDCRIAVLYSQLSLYVAWIQDGDIRSGKSALAERWHAVNRAWEQAITRMGLQYRAVSYEQLARGEVSRRDFDVLVLPMTLSLSDAELEAVRRFAAGGGLVVADGEPGRFDDHCRPRVAPPLGGVEGVRCLEGGDGDADAFAETLAGWLQPLLQKAGISSQVEIAGARPEVVRFADGEAEYLGIARTPDGRHQVRFRRRAHVYDVRERRYLGEADGVELEDGGRVKLYALLPSPVRALQVQAPAEVGRGERVEFAVRADAERSFRHVFAVRVYAPDGSLQHMYGANLDGPEGAASGGFRLAHNDPTGEWRIVASDAATGVTAETRVRVR